MFQRIASIMHLKANDYKKKFQKKKIASSMHLHATSSLALMWRKISCVVSSLHHRAKACKLVPEFDVSDAANFIFESVRSTLQ